VTFTAPDEDHLRDIAVALRRAQSFAEGMNRQRYLEDELIQAAVQYQLMVAGEAVKRLSVEFRRTHPDVNWSAIAGMRDVLIHAYHRVSTTEVWHALESIPPVLEYIEALLEPHRD
jgi:uncharacterized protein with HEPN domain